MAREEPPTDDDGRRYKLAEVSSASLEGWRAFTAKHGGTPTALAELVGIGLAQYADVPTDELPEYLREAATAAAALAASRRRRGHPER